MQFLINELGPLAAYGEYSEQVSTHSAKKTFQPINHLGSELSPYLLQHAKNPVGWYSWCDEAFEAARVQDKPIFLSIGYSSEHWCHVMERECFNDTEVAGLMNDACIPVLVDREERPDIDNLFMEVCKIQNGSAGWPLNIFLTPEARPFFCTTWLPKRTTGQMPGITDLLPRVKWLWHVQRDYVERAANDLYELVKERFDSFSGKSGGRIGKHKAYEALNELRKSFDIRWGGFNTAPKFPEPVKLIFLLKMVEEKSGASKRDKSDAFTMTDITLRRMWRGGIHDHLGGGFSRYSVDERWLVPHFEKLLCDQAMLLLTVSKAQELQQNSFHRLMAEDIIFCLTRDFSSDASFSQGFKSAIDGDTQEGEGRYYLWTEDEIRTVLPENDAGLFCAAYGVLPSGNFRAELAGSQMGCNILYEASTVNELARRYGIKGSEVGTRLLNCRKLLLDFRDKRNPLKADNKVLMSWNGLAIGALAHASVVFDVPQWRDMAERTALFIQKNFTGKDKNVMHRCWIDGHLVQKIEALMEDYAYFLWGIIELYKAAKYFKAGEKQLNDWIKLAQNLADALIKFFTDQNIEISQKKPDHIFFTLNTPEDMNCLPSSIALGLDALDELAIIVEEKKYTEHTRKIINNFSHYASENPVQCLALINADLDYKPVKNKPAPQPAPVLTDEELNRPEPAPEVQVQDQRPARASRRTARQEAGNTARTERRSARQNRRTRT